MYGVCIPWVCSSIVGINVGACIGFNAVVQTITIDVVVNRITDEITIGSAGMSEPSNGLERQSPSIRSVYPYHHRQGLRSNHDVGLHPQAIGSVAIKVCHQDADLNSEFIVEQAAIGIDGEVGQVHQSVGVPQIARSQPRRTGFWQVWFDFKG